MGEEGSNGMSDSLQLWQVLCLCSLMQVGQRLVSPRSVHSVCVSFLVVHATFAGAASHACSCLPLTLTSSVLAADPALRHLSHQGGPAAHQCTGWPFPGLLQQPPSQIASGHAGLMASVLLMGAVYAFVQIVIPRLVSVKHREEPLVQRLLVAQAQHVAGLPALHRFCRRYLGLECASEEDAEQHC